MVRVSKPSRISARIFEEFDHGRQGKTALEVADAVFRVDRLHAGVFLEVDPTVDSQHPVLNRDINVALIRLQATPP